MRYWNMIDVKDQKTDVFFSIVDKKDDLISRLQNKICGPFRKRITWFWLILSNLWASNIPLDKYYQLEQLYLTFSQLTIINFCFVISPTVKKLTNKLPDLLSKIESINQQLLPLGNISDNVDRIRELIQQARDAANKVGVSPIARHQGSFFDMLPHSSRRERLLYLLKNWLSFLP